MYKIHNLSKNSQNKLVRKAVWSQKFCLTYFLSEVRCGRKDLPGKKVKLV